MEGSNKSQLTHQHLKQGGRCLIRTNDFHMHYQNPLWPNKEKKALHIPISILLSSLTQAVATNGFLHQPSLLKA